VLDVLKSKKVTVVISDEFCRVTVYLRFNNVDNILRLCVINHNATQPEVKATIEGISALVYKYNFFGKIEYK